MPTLPQVESLLTLLDTRTAITVIETHEARRVMALFNQELQRQRGRSGQDVAGARATLDSLLRHLVALPESSVRHLVRLTLGDGQVTAADLARVLSAKQASLGVAELLVFEQNLPPLDDVAGMKALKRWLLLRREPFLEPGATGLPLPRGVLLLRGDETAAGSYPADAQRGLRHFVGRGQCSTCHTGPMISNGEFGDTGLPHFVRPGVVDASRHAGITALQANPHNLLSRWANTAGTDATTKTRHVQAQQRNFGEFKVPSLRNVALTAPYMHDGQTATLAGVVRHYSELNLERLHADGEQILKPLHLSDGESADLVAFLQTLSDPQASQWRAPELPPCAGRQP